MCFLLHIDGRKNETTHERFVLFRRVYNSASEQWTECCYDSRPKLDHFFSFIQIRIKKKKQNILYCINMCVWNPLGCCHGVERFSEMGTWWVERSRIEKWIWQFFACNMCYIIWNSVTQWFSCINWSEIFINNSMKW